MPGPRDGRSLLCLDIMLDVPSLPRSPSHTHTVPVNLTGVEVCEHCLMLLVSITSFQERLERFLAGALLSLVGCSIFLDVGRSSHDTVLPGPTLSAVNGHTHSTSTIGQCLRDGLSY